MEIDNIIVHKLDKEKRVKGEPVVEPKVQIRDVELNKKDPLVIELMDKIVDSYKRGKTFGTFNEDENNHPFQVWLKETLDPEKEISFIDLSKKVMERLRFFIQDENFATGGYIIFTKYRYSEKGWFKIIMVKDRSGFTFTDQLDLEDVQEIDIDKLHQVARIDVDKWKGMEDGYLSFIKTGRGDISNYFLKALGCTNVIPSKQATENVFLAVDKVCGDAGLNVHDIQKVKEQVYDYMEKTRPNTVTIEALGKIIDISLPEEHHDLFVEVANSDEYQISTEFEPNLQALRSFKRVKYEAAHWRVDIDKTSVGAPNSGAEVIYNKDEKTLTIENIPDDLASDLNSLIENNNDEEQN